MTTWTHIGRVLAMGLVAALLGLSGQPVMGQKVNSKKVPLTTADGVELQATLWPNPGGKRDATVMLLHNFDQKKGGGSHQDGWDDLATALNQDGYTVISFDFRGFGESKSVARSFWSKDFNVKGIKHRGMEDTIDWKNFSPSYYPYLVNDIAAVKAYLDRQNDLKNLNASNLIVIGAGEGATLGALWMSLEFKRFRSPGGALIGVPAGQEDPEGKDLVCAIWLTISPTLGSTPMYGLQNWLLNAAGRKHKVPMFFMYGKDDKKNETIAVAHLRGIVGPNFQPGKAPLDPNYKFTRDWAVKDTNLTGSKLLTSALDTFETVKFYLDDNMQKRGAREIRNREWAKSGYYYMTNTKQTLPQKLPNEEQLRPIPRELLR